MKNQGIEYTLYGIRVCMLMCLCVQLAQSDSVVEEDKYKFSNSYYY